ncbi:MAG: NADH-quinone oxidoreductase subunit C [Ancrocorticia sp.]|nr:NADH-quinone oxidoreductase subunit C [Ancrocorticia sp.]MCI1895566.1 NADH-quinone oxidoreductase subunit C [Ancrocorticia sp.]MCI1932329.1 NADH-quinone oxidoreductase subunit C [Ancrocorticia sp.]MCI1962790.1 NADH-quinone oxidoreductase subunit C [Ancrocorticia sp.]MCI2001930.1 NADH-quinone oxidoreductase subunit C [Ancrocorticia sp.]
MNDELTTPSGGESYPAPEVLRQVKGMWGVQGSGDTSGFTGLVHTEVMARPASRPYGGWFDDVVDILEDLLKADGIPADQAIEKVVVENGQLVLFIARDHLLKVVKHLRDDQDLRFEMCLGVSAVNYPNDTGRELHAYYPLFSITHNRFISLEVTCPDEDPHIPSIVPVYPGDDWPEREAWDLMGIVFDGHPGLTRTAMPDDWVGHPQRKDYPLGGIPVEYKGAVVPPPDTRREYN